MLSINYWISRMHVLSWCMHAMSCMYLLRRADLFVDAHHASHLCERRKVRGQISRQWLYVCMRVYVLCTQYTWNDHWMTSSSRAACMYACMSLYGHCTLKYYIQYIDTYNLRVGIHLHHVHRSWFIPKTKNSRYKVWEMGKSKLVKRFVQMRWRGDEYWAPKISWTAGKNKNWMTSFAEWRLTVMARIWLAEQPCGYG